MSILPSTSLQDRLCFPFDGVNSCGRHMFYKILLPSVASSLHKETPLYSSKNGIYKDDERNSSDRIEPLVGRVDKSYLSFITSHDVTRNFNPMERTRQNFHHSKLLKCDFSLAKTVTKFFN